jgi:hypothetical protein
MIVYATTFSLVEVPDDYIFMIPEEDLRNHDLPVFSVQKRCWLRAGWYRVRS